MINRVRELVRATIRAESGMRCSWLSARLSRDLVSHLEYNALLAISVARSVIAENKGERVLPTCAELGLNGSDISADGTATQP
jgi:hypothetical protein